MKLVHSYFFPIVTAILFVLAISSGVISAGENPAVSPVIAFIAKALLALAYIALAGWFLFAFTRSDHEMPTFEEDAEQRAAMFRFAYFFSIFSFALLVLPFTAMVRSSDTLPDAGPIRLLRACVEQTAAPARAASAPSPIDYCPESKGSPKLVTYPWLIAVGGVVARQCDAEDVYCFKLETPAPMTSAAAMAAAAAASAASAAAQQAPGSPQAAAAASAATAAASAATAAEAAENKSKPSGISNMYRVSGGFVVPFYVVVFAFVGGVVNLTRRVPEYQKRSSVHFAGTVTESRVTLLEAREFVVFQLMQLLSSPFVAMLAYYALEPKSVASAVGVAFFSGFATESVLLLLRGMFAGLRPEPTKTAAADLTTAATTQVEVAALDASKAPVKDAKIELRIGTNPIPIVKMTDAAGKALFPGVLVGLVQVDASRAADGQALPALKAVSTNVQLKGGAKETIDLTMAVVAAPPLQPQPQPATTAQVEVTALDGAKAPLKNVKVEMRFGTSPAVSQITDASGKAVFANVPAGPVQIEASRATPADAPGTPALKAMPVIVQLKAGAKEKIDLTLTAVPLPPATAQVEVTALDDKKSPLKDAEIKLRAGTDSNPIVKKTDASGKATFPGLPVGTVQIEASFPPPSDARGKPTLKAPSMSVQLKAGSKELVELTLL